MRPFAWDYMANTTAICNNGTQMMTVQFKLPSIAIAFKVYIFFEGKTGLNNLTVH